MPFNYLFKYKKAGKHIFVPNEAGERRGKRILAMVSRAVLFPDYFFHYRPGGHVAALHSHLQNNFFFRIDLQNFYYSISRNRVAAALRSIGIIGSRKHAEWSCVKNPYREPAYTLPIGFIQSPALSSLVLLRSPLATAIERARADGVFLSVYFDDLIGSSTDEALLTTAFNDILASCEEANFVPNERKLAPPAEVLVAFNCDLRRGVAEVSEARITKFFGSNRTVEQVDAFERYRARVSSRNVCQV